MNESPSSLNVQSLGSLMLSLQGQQTKFNELVSVSSYLLNRTDTEAMSEIERRSHRIAVLNLAKEVMEVIDFSTSIMLQVLSLIRPTLEAVPNEDEISGPN